MFSVGWWWLVVSGGLATLTSQYIYIFCTFATGTVHRGCLKSELQNCLQRTYITAAEVKVRVIDKIISISMSACSNIIISYYRYTYIR